MASSTVLTANAFAQDRRGTASAGPVCLRLYTPSPPPTSKIADQGYQCRKCSSSRETQSDRLRTTYRP
eukprot:5032581-Pleurochrysis_carterae.AAC.1